ncbi:MAG: DUF6036 family nucleotidyltransferase [Bacteroidota bacterium]
MQLSEDFEDFIKLLNDHHVDYMVVGGYALALHGKPRNTGDLDIWIRISKTNANKMVSVMREFGFASLKLKAEDFLKDNFINQIGYPPLRIDIIGEIDGVKFEEAFENRQIIVLEDGLTISYIGLDDFLRNKLSSGRKRDLLDAKDIEKLIKNDRKNEKGSSLER